MTMAFCFVPIRCRLMLSTVSFADFGHGTLLALWPTS
jgi:hypothetical protein